MDLIYANNQFEDIGVIQDYTMDLAYGQTLDSENNFELRLVLQKPQCKAGYYVYVEHTEYGGVIDAIGFDGKDNYLVYRGRTWHGILASKVIEPPQGRAKYSVSGDANEVVAELMEYCGLSDIFVVSDEDSEIDIESWDFRYEDLNTGLFSMLQAYDGKLVMMCENGRVMFHVERSMNYATEEFDSSQVKFQMIQTFIHCNHLVCLGQGKDENRAVIHLFTDENGGIQPYLHDMDAEPLENDDYILDKSMQDDDLKGRFEYVQVYDDENSAIAENYKLLTSEPDDWEQNYTKYYEKTEEIREVEEGEPEIDVQYSEIEPNTQDVYSLLTSKPFDWERGFANYYTREFDDDTGEEHYEPVEGEITYTYTVIHNKPSEWKQTYYRYWISVDGRWEHADKVPKYTKLSKQPKDWKKNYESYYTFDGVNYESISGNSKNKYVKTTKKPSLWSSTWKSYYVKRKKTVNKKKKIVYVQISNDKTLGRRKTAPKWKKNTYYTTTSYTAVPNFKKLGAVYAETMVIPTWADNKYYARVIASTQPPSWTTNVYYRFVEERDMGIEFKPDVYYEMVEDWYASLVESGIEILKDLNDSDELEVDFEESAETYDIGDIVGGVDELTGVETAQPIVEKIVVIEDSIVTINHKVKNNQKK